MRRIGLTGGIASGKSTISDALARKGLPVIDTDVISRELMQPGEPGFAASIAHFGSSILDKNGEIDRAALRRRVFDNPAERQWLEAMLHPLIRERVRQQADKLKDGNVIIVVPLLFESGFDDLVDLSIAIDCPREIQLERLMQRDGVDRRLAEQMLDAQLSNEERLRRADLSIRNDGSRPAEQLAEEVLRLIADKPLASS